MRHSKTSKENHRPRYARTEPFRILVASDAEPAAIGAIRIAALVARRRSASVHALIVAEPFPHAVASALAIAPPPLIDEGGRRAALEDLRFQLSSVRGTRDWAIRAATGFPSETIVLAADRWPASLLVLGTGEHGTMARLLGSETAVKVAAHTKVPMLAVPRNARELPMRAIAAVDFSESSIAAATMAATLLGTNGTLTLLYASPLVVEEPASPTGTLTDLYTAGAREKLATIAGDIRRRTKHKVDTAVATGSIVESLLETAQQRKSDLIALGAHEPSLLERLLVGRVRTEVLRAAPCAVLVVPPPGAAP